MAGIEDVARLAGVSTATVSRALSGKDYVSAKALQKVKAAAEELNYVASSTAYSMATGRTRNIGVVVPFVDRWFFATLLDSAEGKMRKHGYDLTLYNLSGGVEHREKIFSEFLGRKRVDAVLACAVKLSETELQSLARTRKPIVAVGGYVSGVRTVSIDDTETGRLATEHLIALGHVNIAMIGGTPARPDEFQQPNLRRQGYTEALQKAGLPVNDAWFVAADYTMQGGYKAAKKILGDPRNIPTAIFCAADEMAFGAMLAAKDLGMRVPDDISIIGIDDHDLADFFGLSTVSQKVRGQGARAVERLIDLIENFTEGTAINIEENEVWPLELVVRSSTARPKAR